ncbi:MAG: hypothetical protein AB9915_03030 [Candidatus Dojkabacteria bacterium]
MKKHIFLIIPTTLLIATIIFTIYVFIPTIKPYEVVNIDIPQQTEIVKDTPEEKTLDQLLGMEKDKTDILDATILNRKLPPKWKDKKIYFKYTYIGQYDNKTAETLDNLLEGEYKWQKQLDANGNIVMGGIILGKDSTYQLHTHNSFTKANRFFLLGDLLDRYHSEKQLVGTQIQFGDVVLEAKWEKDTKVLQNSKVPYSDLIISTCLERYGDRRLVSGWDIVNSEK